MANTLEKIVQGVVIVGACFAGTRLLTSYGASVQKEKTPTTENQNKTEYKQEKKETPAEKARRKKIEKIEEELTSEPTKIVRNNIKETKGLYKPVFESANLFEGYLSTEEVYGKFVLATRKYIERTLHDVDIRYTNVNDELDVMNKYIDKFIPEHKKANESILELQRALIKIKDIKNSDASNYAVEVSDKAIEVAGLIEKAAKTDLEYLNSFMSYMQKAPNIKMIKILSPVLSNFIDQRKKLIQGCSSVKDYLQNHKKDCTQLNGKNTMQRSKGGYYGGA